MSSPSLGHKVRGRQDRRSRRTRALAALLSLGAMVWLVGALPGCAPKVDEETKIASEDTGDAASPGTDEGGAAGSATSGATSRGTDVRAGTGGATVVDRGAMDDMAAAGSHGGAMIDFGSSSAELRVDAGGAARVWMYDANGKPMDTADMRGTLTYKPSAGDEVQAFLAPAGQGEDAHLAGRVAGGTRVSSGTSKVQLSVNQGGSTFGGELVNRGLAISASSVVTEGKDVPLSGNVPAGGPK